MQLLNLIVHESQVLFVVKKYPMKQLSQLTPDEVGVHLEQFEIVSIQISHLFPLRKKFY